MGGPALTGHRVEGPGGHDIPSLDGLRAISIAIVVLSHTKALLPAAIVNSGLFRYLIGGGLHGVQIFFVLSGYLITMLLLREFERTGRVSLRAFYFRRVLRIFPPFYAYLGVLAILWIAGIVRQDPLTFASAATYTIVYHPHPQGWFVEHTWSLSIEEQFYLIWPAILLIALRKKHAAGVVLLVLIAMPVFRAIYLLASHSVAEHDRLVVSSSSIDMLVMGCLFAFLSRGVRFRSWCDRRIHASVVIALAAAGLLLVPYASTKLSGTRFTIICTALGFTVTALSIAAMLDYVVRRPRSVAGRILNLRAMRHLGLISYSIYLWQQLFTGFQSRFGVLTYAMILAAAEVSLRLIERPSMRIRAHLAHRTNQPSRSAIAGLELN
jgi:peptidoglycan/LPS O-acetylase OafA/YrhL